MKAAVLILLAGILVLAGIVAATGWLVVSSYPAPAPNARGVAFDAPYGVSVLCDGSPPRVYNLYRPSEYVTLSVPKGAWGLRPYAALLVARDTTASPRSSCLAYGAQDPRARRAP